MLGLIQLAVIVRYIDEGEIGLMALVNTILAFAGQLSELGIGNSIIHKQDTNRSQLSSIFWWQVLFGCAAYLIIVLLAVPISRFYDAAELQWMLYLAGATIVINSFGLNYFAILYRDLQFVSLSYQRIVVNVVGFIAVVVLAMLGYGLWALVIGALVKSIVQTTLLFFYGRSLFLPDLRLQLNEIRPHLQFGLYQTGERMANLINSQMDTLIIGKLLGEEALGIYDVIKQILNKLFRMINGVITTVMLPIFAKFQEDKPKISQLYLRQIRTLSSLNFPLFLFIAANTLPLFTYLLNPEWYNAENRMLVVYFCLYFILYSVQNPLGTIVISQGRVKQSFFYNFSLCFAIPIVVYWGAQFDIIMLVKVLTLLLIVRLVLSYYYLLRPIVNFSLGRYISNLFPPLLLSLLSVLGIHYLIRFLPVPLWVSFPLSGVMTGLVYLLLNRQWNPEFWQELLYLLDPIIKRKKQ